MKCLHCNIELTKKTVKNVEVDECEKCKGMWFEDGDLRKAKDFINENLSWLDFDIWRHEDQFRTNPANLPCPRCNRILVSINYADTNVEIDYCPTCGGIWLDKGEFKKIVESLTNELHTKSFSEYIASSIDEAKEIITGPESFISEWKDFLVVLRMLQVRLFVEKPRLVYTIMTIQQANPIR